MTVTYINPPSLPRSPAFAHATIAEAGRTLYIGGQNGVASDGSIAPDAREQARQALRNIKTILDEVGATPADIAKMTIILVDSVDQMAVYEASQQEWSVPTAVSVLRVTGLARPDALVEIEAIAALP
jgi:enamine deaminase RidA (YjgF/YER057c/UK114 family)